MVDQYEHLEAEARYLEAQHTKLMTELLHNEARRIQIRDEQMQFESEIDNGEEMDHDAIASDTVQEYDPIMETFVFYSTGYNNVKGLLLKFKPCVKDISRHLKSDFSHDEELANILSYAACVLDDLCKSIEEIRFPPSKHRDKMLAIVDIVMDSCDNISQILELFSADFNTHLDPQHAETTLSNMFAKLMRDTKAERKKLVDKRDQKSWDEIMGDKDPQFNKLVKILRKIDTINRSLLTKINTAARREMGEELKSSESYSTFEGASDEESDSDEELESDEESESDEEPESDEESESDEEPDHE